MRKINTFIHNLGLGKFFCLLFLFGLILGIITANVFQSSFLLEISELEQYFITNLKSMDINKMELLKLVLIQNFKAFILLIVICFTTLGLPFIIMFVVWNGFKIGFLLSVAILQYKGKGLFLFITLLFPQFILYIPIIFLTLVKCYHLYKNLYYHQVKLRGNRKKVVIDSLLAFLLLGLFLILGSFLEAYVNPIVIKKIMIDWI